MILVLKSHGIGLIDSGLLLSEDVERDWNRACESRQEQGPPKSPALILLKLICQ